MNDLLIILKAAQAVGVERISGNVSYGSFFTTPIIFIYPDVCEAFVDELRAWVHAPIAVVPEGMSFNESKFMCVDDPMTAKDSRR